MSLRNRFALLTIAVLYLAFLAGCGSSTHSPVPPPSGGFSNADFSGTYTFSIAGEDIDAADSPSPFVMSGSFTACGCTAGTLSAGSVDVSDFSGTGSGLAINTTGSGYSISQDGRGKVDLSITTSSGNIPIVLDLVLTSSSHGLVSRFDSGGTGSGTIDLQPSPVTLSTSPYAFSLSGTDLKGDPLSTVGAFTLSSSGSISAGVEDFNDDATPAFESSISGSVTVGSGTAPGTATLDTGFGNLTFDVYAIDAAHLKLIESDGLAILMGDVFAQPSATIPSGTLVFTMTGLDPTGAPFAAGGTVSSDGASQLTNGAEDFNDAGSVDGNTSPAVPTSFNGTFVASPSGSGRFQVALSGFAGGTNFVAYPSSGGVLILEADSGLNAGVTDGAAMTQTTGASLSASEGYGLNLTGVDLTSDYELDEIGQFNTTSSGMSGLLDLNDFTVSNPSTSNLTGSYTPSSNSAQGSATFDNQGVFYYAVDGSTVLLLSTDSTDVSVGTFEEQTTPSAASADIAQRHLATLKSVPRPRASHRSR